MKFSPQQSKALLAFKKWFTAPPEKRGRPYFMIAGWPGTGKTSIARHAIEGISGPVYFAAYTGKAAHRMMQSGVPNVSTVHKLIYIPKNKSQERLKGLEAERAELKTHNPVPLALLAKLEEEIIQERKNLDRPMFSLNTESPLFGASLLVIDEYSFIDEQMGEDLLSFNIPILALGDPDQLPPVRGVGFFRGEPDVRLTEIHRQALDNPIIWMAREVREGRTLSVGQYGDSRVVDFRQFGRPALADAIMASDQLLVGKNDTRRSSNNRIRELRGATTKYPILGDKLVCLKNNHDIGLLNGQIWTVTKDSVAFGTSLALLIADEEGKELEVTAHSQYFEGGEPDYWEIGSAQSFDYGYALTVHKAQGSEFDKVVLLDEWFSKHRRQWLNTAITRASKSIIVVKM